MQNYSPQINKNLATRMKASKIEQQNDIQIDRKRDLSNDCSKREEFTSRINVIRVIRGFGNDGAVAGTKLRRSNSSGANCERRRRRSEKFGPAVVGIVTEESVGFGGSSGRVGIAEREARRSWWSQRHC